MADPKAAMVAGGAFLIGACFGAYFYQGPIRAMFARKRGKKMFTVKDWDTWGFKVTPPAEDRFSNDLQRHYFHGHYHHHHHSDAPCYDNNLDDSGAAPYESWPPPHADGAAGCRGLSSVVNSRQDATDVHYGTLLELGHKTCVLEAQEDRAKLADAMTKDTITEQQFSRNRELFGIEGQLRVHEAFVVVVGLGGVGSHAALHLVRTGVGNIRIVDHDHVTISSLNRHAVANRGDVGHPKAVVMKHHFNRIFPECNVDAQPVMLTAHSADELLSGSPDFVLDCIDNIDTKVALLKTCFDKRIPVISATGAGTRMDVTRVRVVDIKDSAVDPLARAVRHRLRRLHNITEGIQVVISTEPPRRKPLPLEECVGLEYDCSSTDLSDFQMLPNFRIRTIPVCSPVPAVFGAAMAAHVVAALAQQELYPEPVVRFTEEQYRVLYDRLLQSEEDGLVDLDLNDVVYLVKELWQGRSARDPHAHGEGGRARFRAVNSMGLTRWDRSQPASVSNMVLLTFQEIEAHERTTLEQIRMEEPEYYERVTCLLKRASAENEFLS